MLPGHKFKSDKLSMKYYRLDSDQTRQNTFIRANSHAHVLITNGERIPEDIPTPFEFIMEIEELEQEEETEEVVYETPNLVAYVRNCSLMDKRMVKTLKSAGVETVQTFPAIVRHPETNFEFHNYEVVNILNLASGANRQASDTHPLGPSNYFHKLVIDESKVNYDLLLFRLAEYSFEVIIQERVARALVEGNFNGLLIESLDT